LVGIKSDLSLNGAMATAIGGTAFETLERYKIRIQSPAAALAAHPSDVSLKPLNPMKVVGCARSGCDQEGTNSCFACRKEYYCIADCQKQDWKAHKILYKLIKLMPDALQPFKISQKE
jgi:hypothetical protein